MARKAYYHTTLTLTDEDQEKREEVGEAHSLISIFRKGLDTILEEREQ